MAVHVKKGGELPAKATKTKRSKKFSEGDLVVSSVNVIAPNRNKQNISDWRTAHKVAEFVHNPNRVALYDLFEDVMLDPFLTGIIGKRMRMVRNKGLRLVDRQGKHLEAFDSMISSKKFRRLRKYIFNTIMYGLTGIEFIPGAGEMQYKIIPRKHIKPHLGIISREQYGNEGWDYLNAPNIWVLQSDEEDNNFGLLLKAIPYVLFKRHGFVNWSEFVELYGQPTRVAKYDAYDNGTRQQLEEALVNAGRSLSLMIPKQAELQIIDGKSSNSDGKLQAGFKDACDEQMAVLVLGVTGTTKSSGADGYAQSKTHEGQQLEITQDDMDYEIETLNDEDFFNILRSYGYTIPDGAQFEHVEEADLAWLQTKMAIDKEVATQVEIEDDYWYKTYNVPKPKNVPADEDIEADEVEENDEEDLNDGAPTDAPPDKPGKAPAKGRPTDKKRNTVAAWFKRFFAQASRYGGRSTIDINNIYSSRCGLCGGLHSQPVAAAADDEFTAICNNIAKMLYDGKVSAGYIDDKLYSKTADMLMQGVYKGLGADAFDYFDNRNELATYLQHNIHAFSAAKSLTELQHFNALMIGADGKPRTRTEFINAVSDAGYKFNKNYLSTEYDTAYSSAQTAMEFNSFADDDVLQISTAGDAQVRPEHQLLDKFTAYKNDPVWQRLCPPFDYYCRCRIVPGVASRISNVDKGALIRNAQIPKYFQRNTATDKVIFEDSHPYYQKAGKAKLFTAVNNYNMPTVQRLYETNDFPAPAILESKEAANDWWTQKAGMLRGHIDIQDHSGVTVRCTDVFRVHVYEDNTDARWRYVTNLEDILKNPDEVWSRKVKGLLEKEYIKYYDGVPHGIRVNSTEAFTFIQYEKSDGGINFKSLDNVRRGILLYKK